MGARSGVESVAESGDTGGDETAVPVVAGTIAGACAWIIGYLLTFVATRGTLREDTRVQLLESVAGERLTLELVGWVYFNAHGVAVEIPQRGLLSAVAAEQNVVTESGGFELFLLAVPPVVLVVAGAIVTFRRASEVDELGPIAAASSGATVVVGYLFLAAVTLYVCSVPLDGEYVRPAPLSALVLAGVGYPLVFGAVGGVSARVVSNRR